MFHPEKLTLKCVSHFVCNVTQSFYYTILNCLSITRHTASGYGWNRSFVSGHRQSGQWPGPTDKYLGVTEPKKKIGLAKIWLLSHITMHLAGGTNSSNQSRVTLLDEQFEMVQYFRQITLNFETKSLINIIFCGAAGIEQKYWFNICWTNSNIKKPPLIIQTKIKSWGLACESCYDSLFWVLFIELSLYNTGAPKKMGLNLMWQ